MSDPQTTDFEEMLRPAVEAKLIEDILISGNHLANSLIAAKCMPDLQADYHSVLTTFGQPCADMWVAWKAIMDFSKWRRMENAA